MFIPFLCFLSFISLYSFFKQTDEFLHDEKNVKDIVSAFREGCSTLTTSEREFFIASTRGADFAATNPLQTKEEKTRQTNALRAQKGLPVVKRTSRGGFKGNSNRGGRNRK